MVIELAAVALTKPAPVVALGSMSPPGQAAVDGSGGREPLDAKTDPWDTGFVDLHGGGGLLGQIEGRTSWPASWTV